MRDGRPHRTQKLDEDEEEGIIAVCYDLIVFYIAGLACVSRVNNGHIIRIEQTCDKVQHLVGRSHLSGQINAVLRSGYWIGSFLFGGKRSSIRRGTQLRIISCSINSKPRHRCSVLRSKCRGQLKTEVQNLRKKREASRLATGTTCTSTTSTSIRMYYSSANPSVIFRRAIVLYQDDGEST